MHRKCSVAIYFLSTVLSTIIIHLFYFIFYLLFLCVIATLCDELYCQYTIHGERCCYEVTLCFSAVFTNFKPSIYYLLYHGFSYHYRFFPRHSDISQPHYFTYVTHRWFGRIHDHILSYLDNGLFIVIGYLILCIICIYIMVYYVRLVQIRVITKYMMLYII